MLSNIAAFVFLAHLLSPSTSSCLTSKNELREINPTIIKALHRSEFDFSAEMLNVIGKTLPTDNLVFSPNSIFKALFLVYFMSANETEEIMKDVLHLPKDKDKLDMYAAYFLDNYYSRLRAVQDMGYKISSVNRIYYSKRLSLRHCIKVLFGEELVPVNFQDNSRGTVKQINRFVQEQTQKIIKKFFSEDDINGRTVLVLINAAYFKGSWQIPFKEKFTRLEKFTLSNGSEIETLMMRSLAEYKYVNMQQEGWEAVELPYVGDDISMVVLLPFKNSKSTISRLLTDLDISAVIEALNATEASEIEVTLPKFTVEHSLDLESVLKTMNLGSLFSNPDLSSMSEGEDDHSFTEARHKAKLRVDEAGTEAAAVTGLVMSRMMPPSITMEHPFLYFIYDKQNNVILFFGTYTSPSD